MRRTWLIIVAFALSAGMVAVGSSAGANTAATNGKISFNRWSPDGVPSAFTIDPDGSNEQPIEPNPSPPILAVSCQRFAPDGSKLVCGAWDEVGVQPATTNPDGSDFTLLNPTLPLDLYCAFWSPDASRLLCHSEGLIHADDAGLYTVRSSDAEDLVQISATPEGYADTMLGYSPDGSRILFSRVDESNAGALFAVNPDGSGLFQLNPPDLPVISTNAELEADWSPDGSQVAFAAAWRTGQGRGTALYIVNTDGTGLRRITPSGLGAVSAQWSPDGQLIAFTSKLRANPQVWVVHPDGTGLKEVTSGSDGSISEFPVWSPDSTKLLFERTTKHGEALWVVNADGTGLYDLTAIPGDTSYAWGTATPS
jgi:dipeptidyl aminopeptidase/acylaminoacyl peptidase